MLANPAKKTVILNKIYNIFLEFGLLRGLVVLSYKLLKKLKLCPPKPCFYKYPEGCKNRIYYRYDSSDTASLRQVLDQDELSCFDNKINPQLIIDCGAYIGCSSIYFLNQYPEAHVVAIEPHSKNFKICHRNLKPYKKRVTLIHSAVWSHRTGLVAYETDWGEWAVQVRECRKGEKPNISAVNLYDLLEKSGFGCIDILKIDIERSELEVFSHNYDRWLSRVKHIAIELHDEQCKEVFFKTLSQYKYDLSYSGELVICKNISLK
ncbi:MAG: FkbM family methyltransferase [Candidatus Omnitrophota bacterium]